MKKFLFLLTTLFFTQAFAETFQYDFFVELRGWPEPLKTKWQESINELYTGDCFTVDNQHHTVVADEKTFACSRFSEFKNVKQIKPYTQERTKVRALVIYDAKKPEMALIQFYKWDGKKQQRVLNSTVKYARYPELKSILVGYSVK